MAYVGIFAIAHKGYDEYGGTEKDS